MEIKKYTNDINDFRFWKSEEAAHKVAGSIRRLNELGTTSLALTNSHLENADLRNVDLSEAYLINANLKNTILLRTNFSNADLRETKFDGADFHEIELTGAIVTSKTWFQDLIDKGATRVENMMEKFEVVETEMIDENAPWEELEKYYKIRKKANN